MQSVLTKLHRSDRRNALFFAQNSFSAQSGGLDFYSDKGLLLLRVGGGISLRVAGWQQQQVLCTSSCTEWDLIVTHTIRGVEHDFAI